MRFRMYSGHESADQKDQYRDRVATDNRKMINTEAWMNDHRFMNASQNQGVGSAVCIR